MTTISARCAALSDRIGRLKQRQALRGQAEELQRRRTELETARVRLAVALAQVEVLVGRGTLEQPPWPDTTRLLDSLGRVSERLEKAPSELTKGTDYRLVLSEAERVAATFGDVTAATWAGVVAANDPTNEQLLLRLELVPGQETSVARVRTLRGSLVALGEAAPTTEATYDQFLDVARALGSAWEALDHGDLPDSVLKFFKAAQRRAGAPMSLFTAEVQEWLDEHQMTVPIRVHFRSGA